MIEIHQLSVTKSDQTICSVSKLTIAPGERVAILGANGSGKTTLLRVLSSLQKKYRGRCIVNVPRKDRVYVHQSPYMFRGSVLFNTTYGPRARGMNRMESQRRALHWLELLGLHHQASTRVLHLSGGERRRLALARAMILQPPLLLLDEPLADLDHDGTAAVSTALDELSESTILIASPTTLPPGLTSRDYHIGRM